MDISQRLDLSYFETITVLNEDHHTYLVQHRSTHKLYVKKVLEVYNLPIYEYLSRHVIAGLPRIICFAEDQDKLTVIEEFISGCSLQENIDRKILTAASVKRYMQELCDILETLHSAEPPIIHRDIKPSNIIITSCDHVVLLDFNAAKFYSGKAASDTVLLGTQGYAAPEQYGFGSSSPKTDIYALGILLQEMTASLPQVPDKFTDIIQKCTHMDPEDRFSSAADVKSAFDAPSSSVSDPCLSPLRTRDFLPPGFRTGTHWKMITAVAGYAVILWLSLSLVSRDTAGAVLPAGPQWLERIFFLVMELSVVCITCNYLHIQRIFPLCRMRQPVLRWLGVLLFDGIVIVLLTLLMLVIEPLFFPG